MIVELTEHEPVLLARAALPPQAADALWRDWGPVVTVEFPSPRTDDQWKLTAGSFAGLLLLPGETQLVLRPKVPVRALLRLWERAHGLPVGFLSDEVKAETIPQACEGLAYALAREVLKRAHEGWVPRALERREPTSYVRGRMDVTALRRNLSETRPPCIWTERTEDAPLTRLCRWALHRVAHGGWAGAGTLAEVGRALSVLSGVPLRSHTIADCDRLETRRETSARDRKLLVLCRWVLEGESFAPAVGARRALGFFIPMERLFERAVTRWLEEHAGREWTLQVQPCVPLPPLETPSASLGQPEPQGEGSFFRPDIVVIERETRRPRCVLDAKYSGNAKPSSREVAQVVAYATALGCRDALLVYPDTLPAHRRAGVVRVRNVAFPLDTDWDTCGDELLGAIRAGQ